MRLRINGREIAVEAGWRILDAAASIGIRIPTLCYRAEYGHLTSCMVCLVKDVKTGQLVPACSARVVDGMDLETNAPEVVSARRKALELLLSEHVGDCEAPCTRGCPAHMDIPRMIRALAAGDTRAAIEIVKERIALPMVLGRICPAPCEKVCRRGQLDGALSICLLKRFAADWDMACGAPYMPVRAAGSSRRVAVVGSGPAGLAAAYYLLRWGHECDVYEERAEPGGMLRFGVGEERLSREVLMSEIRLIERLGAKLHLNVSVGADILLDDLRVKYDAVILAVGKLVASERFAGVHCEKNGIPVARDTFQTNVDRVFAAGDVVKATRLAVRSIGDGRSAARAVHQMLSGLTLTGSERRFDSRVGKLSAWELAEFAAETDGKAGEPAEAPVSHEGFTDAACRAESARCMHCDCRKNDDCKLRRAVDEHAADARHVAGRSRASVQIVREHPQIVFEPGKCIRCGLCVTLTRLRGEKLGLAFLARGYDVRVGVPFGDGLDKALESSWQECVDACPTGALALKN